MDKKRDWLPRNHEDLYKQVVLTWNYALAPGNRARMGLAPDSPQGIWFDTVFTPAFNNYGSAYVAWSNPHERTDIIITKLEEAEAVLKPLYRILYTGTLKNSPVVTDDDLQSMGLPKRPSSSRTPSPVATTSPASHVDTGTQRRVIIYFSDQHSNEETAKAKPPGQHGAEIRWAVLDIAPVDISALTHSSFDTRSPFTLDFEGHDRGKHFYYSLCWENTRGEKGPYSPIVEVVIP
ncbi:MAG: hypothetical protein LBU42_00345 [Prevotellaceae bacterium]|jgi:hypothetical protein|nr:hypothetical protein [Prevotellaceae bacterium]